MAEDNQPKPLSPAPEITPTSLLNSLQAFDAIVQKVVEINAGRWILPEDAPVLVRAVLKAMDIQNLKRLASSQINEEQPKHRSSKNRRHWCKGIEGRHHQTALAPANYCKDEIKTLIELCTKCGKHLNHFWKPYLLSPRSNRAWQIWDEAWTRYRKQCKL